MCTWARGKPPQEAIAIMANIKHSWWHHLVPHFDVLVASPRCQPWSGKAAAEMGLDVVVGRVLIHTVVQCIYLRPAVLCIEKVDGSSVHHAAQTFPMDTCLSSLGGM